MKSADVLSLEALSQQTEVPVRTIRYYIQRGLVPRPSGEKKGAFYGQEHLDALLQIKRWIGAGLSLDRIHALFEGVLDQKAMTSPAVDVSLPAPQARVIYQLMPGVELIVDPSKQDLSPRQVADLMELLTKPDRCIHD